MTDLERLIQDCKSGQALHSGTVLQTKEKYKEEYMDQLLWAIEEAVHPAPPPGLENALINHRIDNQENLTSYWIGVRRGNRIIGFLAPLYKNLPFYVARGSDLIYCFKPLLKKEGIKTLCELIPEWKNCQ